MVTSIDLGSGVDSELALADRVAQELGRLIRLVSRMRAHSAVTVAPVLAELLEHGPLRVGEIATALGTDPSTVSRQVTALVEAGLVMRRVDPDDGRAHLLAATDAGASQCVAGRHRRVTVIATVLADWPEDSRKELAELLGRFADDMQGTDRRTAAGPGGEN